jgi:hypothetical protein
MVIERTAAKGAVIDPNIGDQTETAANGIFGHADVIETGSDVIFQIIGLAPQRFMPHFVFIGVLDSSTIGTTFGPRSFRVNRTLP